jgi:hypothetical protein
MAAKREKANVINNSDADELSGNADILGEQEDADVIF